MADSMSSVEKRRTKPNLRDEVSIMHWRSIRTVRFLTIAFLLPALPSRPLSVNTNILGAKIEHIKALNSQNIV